MSIDIICPLYNAEEYIEHLHKSLIMQKKVNILNIRYVLTESNDNTEKYLNLNKINYKKISKSEFSHSLVREKEALQSKADILVFVTQDVVIEDDLWLYKLTKDIQSGECEAAYSRQLSKYDNIERYTREKNYPTESYVVSKRDISNRGLRTFFFSDAASAISCKVFKELNGYDGKDLVISEDMYIAYKIIMNNYRIKYCSDSVVFHSHDFTLKEIYNRYYDTGIFFKENKYLDKFGTNSTGGGMAKYIIKRSVKDKNIKVIIRFLPDMMARFIGMKMGKFKGAKNNAK